MKYQAIAAFTAIGLASAGPLPHHMKAREVPQEHSHNIFLDLCRTALNLNNPKNILDPVFGLLGNAAAAAGAGAVTNLDCLQQETADQAFTNAKAAGDIPGMAGALVYRALERNTGKVGLASVLCTETAANPEIAALSQHQDPASPGAAAANKAVALELARQLAAVGADPLLALESGTFAPGDLGDATAKGNTCDTENDEPGCILSQRLLVLDASEAEISSAVAGITPTITGTGELKATHVNFAGLSVAGGGSVAADTTSAAADTTTAAAEATASASDAECTAGTVTVTETAAQAGSTCSVITTTVAAEVASSMLATSTATATATATASASGTTNVQKFTGTLGGPAPPVVSSTGARPFSVNGNTFVNLAAAVQRSCDVQHNLCANAANSGSLAGGVGQCETQQRECVEANSAASTKAKRAGAFGSCGSPAIVFEAGLDGRNTEAFIAEDRASFDHGSALNIGVIAGFICQRLDSSCKAGADVVASCTSASAAAVATTQNQAAADVFNGILGVGGNGDGVAATATTAAAATEVTGKAAATETGSSVVMTITQCA